ncbi:RraA family protein [Roseovarius sp. Pro17]|uniref:RraA family protein n=1 Tax=Roseovarius sp. Pro17 TaxID=3108175 RepID=UPI002D79A052|nr:RraA family protein [Roseovarius sp. Pro17]
MTQTNDDADIADLLKGFSTCAVANISDNLDRAVGARGIRPFHNGGTMVGTALTVKAAPGDNTYIYQALENLSPSDVIVVDGAGYEDRALIGDIMANIAESKGAAGIVVDGSIRDVDEISSRSFPVFARGVIHLGPYKGGVGKLNVPISIGGMPVNPGDIVVGDADGIVAFSPGIAKSLLEATRQQQAKEADILASIANGTYAGAYSK